MRTIFEACTLLGIPVNSRIEGVEFPCHAVTYILRVQCGRVVPGD